MSSSILGSIDDAMVHGYTNANECNGQLSPMFAPMSSLLLLSLGVLHARHEVESRRVSHRFNCRMGYSVELMI